MVVEARWWLPAVTGAQYCNFLYFSHFLPPLLRTGRNRKASSCRFGCPPERVRWAMVGVFGLATLVGVYLIGVGGQLRNQWQMQLTAQSAEFDSTEA